MVNSRKLLSVISDVRFSRNLDTHEPETSDLSNLPFSAHGNPQSTKHAFETTTFQQSIGYKTFRPDTRRRTCRAAANLSLMSTWAIFTARVLRAAAEFCWETKENEKIYKLLQNQCASRMNQNVSQHRRKKNMEFRLRAAVLLSRINEWSSKEPPGKDRWLATPMYCFIMVPY